MVTKINNYVLLPCLADWSIPPQLTLAWDTELDSSLRGYEQRGSLRATPRPTLAFVADVRTPDAYAALRAALVEGLRLDPITPANTPAPGLFCAPWAARESWCVSAEGAAITIEPSTWPWAVNDWLIAFDAEENWAVGQITAVADAVITLAAPLGVQLAAGDPVLPLFFGRLNQPELDPQHARGGTLKIELVGDTYQVPANPPACCAEEDTWEDAIWSAPEPDLTFSVAVDGLTVTFNAATSRAGSSPIAGYEWDFGDGFIGTGANVVHKFFSPDTTYTVTLTVRDQERRWASTTQEVAL